MTVDLRTRYLGLELRSPIVASAAPHNSEPAMAKRLEAAGVGAIVLPSLFEEEVLSEELGLNSSLEQGTEHFAEALDYFPAVDTFVGAADRYLGRLERVKAEVGVPVVASLNASTSGGWVRYARRIQDAGADALELNVYRVATDPHRTAADLEAADLELIERRSRRRDDAARGQAESVLLGLRELRRRSHRDGNRRIGPLQPVLSARPRPRFARCRTTTRSERALGVPAPGPLDRDPATAAWPGRVVGGDVRSAVAATDAIKGLMVGADIVMMTSALLRHGPEHVATVETDLRAWMSERDYESVDQLRGSASTATVENPDAFHRANYMATLRSWVAPRELTPSAPKW